MLHGNGARPAAVARLWLLAWLLWGAPASSSSGAADETGARAVVAGFNDRLLQAMRLGSYAQRVAALAPAVGETFDAGSIARISLGRHWKTLTQQQQGEYTALMRELIVTTYAARFNSYSGQRFQIIGQKPLPRERMQVRTLLLTGSEEVSLDYQLVLRDRGWQVYDVVAQGVSDLSLKRAAYSAAFAMSGLAGVQEEIGGVIAKNAAGSP